LITKPKYLGGWGIRNLDWFGRALETKSLWRTLFRSGLWSVALRQKYLKGVDVVFWLRYEAYSFLVVSLFWKNLMLSLPLLKKWISWNVGSRSKVLIGLGPFAGSGSHYRLSSGLLRHLHSLNDFSLAHIKHSSSLNSLGSIDWLLSNDLGLEGDMALEWES
jgi:hypothetical protein